MGTVWFQVFHVLVFILSANPLFKTRRGGFFCLDEIPSFAGILVDLSELFENCSQIAWKTTSFPSFYRGKQGGLRKVWDQECSQIKRQNTHEDVKPKRYKKLWNLHWALRTAWRKKQEGENKRQRTASESAQEMNVDGQDLTICGGCQGYMDFFSEVFCVVSFFFLLLLYIFAHQETPRWKTLSKTERKNKHPALLSRTRLQSKRPFFWFVFLRAAFLNLDIREGNSPSLLS